MDLQIMRFMDLFDRIPSYMTYHFGLHALDMPHALFQQITRDGNIPSRHATQYTKLYDPLSLVLYDSLNTPGVTVRNVHCVLDKIEQNRAPAELMVHFGEKAYGWAQYRAMTDSSVKQRLCSFDVVMPSEAVQRLKVMAPK